MKWRHDTRPHPLTWTRTLITRGQTKSTSRLSSDPLKPVSENRNAHGPRWQFLHLNSLIGGQELLWTLRVTSSSEKSSAQLVLRTRTLSAWSNAFVAWEWNQRNKHFLFDMCDRKNEKVSGQLLLMVIGTQPANKQICDLSPTNCWHWLIVNRGSFVIVNALCTQ